MKNIAMIWDLDGTLLDSYGAIMHAIEITYRHYGWEFDDKLILKFILAESVGLLLDQKAKEMRVDNKLLKDFYSADLKKRDDELKLMPGALEILEWTKAQDIKNYVYTHKGDNAFPVLKQLGIFDYFVEIITADTGFKRKPDSEAIDYLIEKYQLDANKTYYIGDRRLDMEAALNAGINSINLVQPNQEKNTKIDQLEDIMNLEID